MTQNATDRTVTPRRALSRVAPGIVIALLMIAVLAGAWVAWKELLAPRLIPKRFGTVVDNALYRSGRIHPALLPEVLDQYGIDDIVTLTDAGKAPQYEALEQTLANERGIHLQRFPLSGNGTGDPALVVGALVAVHDAIGRGEQVLVQCAAGTERTGGVIYLYRTLVLGEPPDDAYAELLRYGHRPPRNPELAKFLNANMQYFADALAARGILHDRQAPLPMLPDPPVDR
jgi:protein tyrosine/serine phosphatase